jgi:hypothetical protein
LITNDIYYYYLFSVILFFSINILFVVNFLKQEKYKFVFTVSIIIIISIFTGIRGFNIGLDTGVYVNIFLGIDQRAIEPIFPFLAFIFNLVTEEPQYFLLLINLLINLIVLMSYKKVTINYPIAMAIFLSTLLFINMNINTIRQGLAIALSFYAMVNLLNRNLKLFWLFFFFALLTHTSSIFLLGIYLIRNIQVNKKNLILFVSIIFLLWFITFSDILGFFKDYNEYINRVYWYFKWDILKPWTLKHVYYFVFFMVFVYIIYAYKKLDFKNKFILKLYLYGIFLIFLFREEEMVVDRFFYYFFTLGILLILELRVLIKNKKIFFISLIFLTNIWLAKTMILQYPNWFITKEAIR